MIKNRDIIFFADDWGRFPSTMQHIGKVLAKDNRIIWVGSLGLRKPKLNFSDFKRVIEKLKGLLKPNKTVAEKAPVIIVNPFVLPFHDSAFIRKVNYFLLKNKIKKAVTANGFKDFIIITSSPVMENLVGRLGEKSSHYICLDDYTLFDGAFKSLRQLEINLLQKVNTSFSVSEGLQNSRIPATGKSYFVAQGVELKHFRETKNSISKKELGLKDVVIGFFGLISEWIDTTLFTEAAKRYPEYSFLIIGRATVDVSDFALYKNIIYLGPVQYNLLPEYACLFDVGLIPFKVNELTIAANPLKLLEYMSIGIPVVSTNLPEVGKFSEYVVVAEDNEKFIKGIKTAVETDNEEIKSLRMAKADSFSWESIADGISEKILISEKS